MICLETLTGIERPLGTRQSDCRCKSRKAVQAAKKSPLVREKILSTRRSWIIQADGPRSVTELGYHARRAADSSGPKC
ncbi:hypothetical protein A0H81_05098 [Grifola frondosa]|uniref:Uncharacterized protein n=1 Tax=Grifola frondosa TaxID=5627 RepID=A0A1C7MCK3_GRIFR|nr:hypothetical protein A0H81_05098 [Grifola frondosa]